MDYPVKQMIPQYHENPGSMRHMGKSRYVRVWVILQSRFFHLQRRIIRWVFGLLNATKKAHSIFKLQLTNL